MAIFKCKHWRKCGGYRKDSYTCNGLNRDRNYCGKFREMEAEKWAKK